MTLEELYQIILNGYPQPGVFALDVRNLESDSCTAIGADYLPGYLLNLQAAAQPVMNENDVVVTGTGVDQPFKDIPGISVRFFVVDGVSQFEMLAVFPHLHTLASSFKPLEESICAVFTYVATPAPVLSLSTWPIADMGMQFSGNIDLNAATGGLSSLLGVPDYPVAGPIVMAANGSGLVSMVLTGGDLPSINIGVGVIGNISALLTFDVETSLLSDSEVALPYFVIRGSLPFEALDQNYEIPLRMVMTDPEVILFEAEISDLIQATMDELLSLFGNSSISPWGLLPSDVSLDSVLQLANLYLIYNDAYPGNVEAFGIQFANRTPWTLVELEGSGTELILSSIVLDFAARSPLSSAFVLSLDFEAEITLTEIGSLGVAAAYPGWPVHAWIPRNGNINVSNMAVLFLGAPSGLPPIQLSRFNLLVQPGDQGSPTTYSVDINFNLGWYIGDLPVVLQEVSLMVDTTQGNFIAGITAILNVSGIDLAISANNPGASGEWIFSGMSAPGQQLPIGTLLLSLAEIFGVDTALPTFLTDFTISDLAITFNTLTQDFTFHCTGNFVLDETPVLMTVDIKVLQQNNGTFRKTFAGRIVFSGFQFDLIFDSDYSQTYFIANYYNVDGGPVVVKDLIAPISASVASYIPEGLTFDLKDALFAWESVGGANKFLFAMDWDFGVNLSNLPLVGRYFRTDETLDMAFQVMVASDAFTGEEVTRLNALVPPNTITFPAQGIADGLNLITTFRLGGEPTPITLPVGINPQSGALQTTGTTWSGGTQPLWYNLQKTFGPVYFNRVGVLYRSDNSRIYFYLDASLNTAGMSMALTGLNISTSITDFTDLSFGLDGLALDYASGPVQIGGAFLGSIQTINGITTTLYSGAAIAEMEGLGIAAMGSYADYDGNTSLFIYGELDAPIVVQPWLTITGISGGFGYNRNLLVPTLNNVMSFPLVAQAMSMSGGGSAKSMEQMLADMNTYLAPEVGQYWLAAGLKFNTFKILDSFVLLTAAFGNRFQLNLIGISTLMMPPDLPSGVEPLAELQLAVLATFDWDSGYLGVTGQLTQNSFLLSRSVKLTGGFAVCTWFKGEKKGSFVATVGGYHPQYKVPAGYPVVPRLGFNWQLSDNLTLKGESYLALTSAAVMAGMNFTATWQQGSIKAWFSTSADFIISWKPYYYDARLGITVGAEYTFDHFGIRKTISADVGASLHIWGPDFSGVATVDLSVISFDIAFGSARPTGPKAISWSEFASSFIPATPVGVVPSAGVVGSVTVTQQGGATTQVNVLNPATGAISVSSFIPAQQIAWQVTSNSYQTLASVPTLVGISPMGLAAQSGMTNLKISLQYGTSRNNITWVDISTYFNAEVDNGNAPAALWAGVLSPKLNGPEFVKNLLTGLLLKPKPLSLSNAFQIPKANLSMSVAAYNGHYNITGSYTETFIPGDDNTDLINNTILTPSVEQQRNGLLASMGLVTPINLTITVANMFLDSPQALTTTLS